VEKKRRGNAVKINLLEDFDIYTEAELLEKFQKLNDDDREKALNVYGLVYNQVANKMNKEMKMYTNETKVNLRGVN
jgi:hypothetical protein